MQLFYDWDIQLTMDSGKSQTIEQARQSLECSEVVEFRGITTKEKYYWIEQVLIRFK